MTSRLRDALIGEVSFKRLLRSVLIISTLLYLIVMISAYSFADSIIFQPQPTFYHDDNSIIKLVSANGEKVSAKYFENLNAEYTILFSHGNAEDIGGLDLMLKDFQKNGFAVLSYDYRGYGTSEGVPTEDKVYRDIDAVYDYLTGELRVPPEKIIAHGRSLGGAVAIDLASRKKIGGLIVESSFVTAFRILTTIQVTPFDKFHSINKIKDVGCPVLFMHGRKDNIIPFWHGEKLFAEANEPKFSFWIDEGTHNNIYSLNKTAYLQQIRDFADNLPK